MDDIEYGRDKATIPLHGEMNEAAAERLVDALRKSHKEHFYERVEISVRSGGGLLVALREILHEVVRLRELGVAVDTYVRGGAGSAAAFLAALGDRRRADKGSVYHFHLAVRIFVAFIVPDRKYQLFYNQLGEYFSRDKVAQIESTGKRSVVPVCGGPDLLASRRGRWFRRACLMLPTACIREGLVGPATNRCALPAIWAFNALTYSVSSSWKRPAKFSGRDSCIRRSSRKTRRPSETRSVHQAPSTNATH